MSRRRGNDDVLGDPPVAISARDQKEIEELYGALRKGKAKLVGPDGESRSLPDSVYSFLVQLIAALQQGKCVHILQSQARLTTAEAAAMLGVSRQFLVNTLEKGEIPYHKVGTHRRIFVHDLLTYKARRDSHRKSVLKDLVSAEMSDGLYDKVPPASS